MRRRVSLRLLVATIVAAPTATESIQPAGIDVLVTAIGGVAEYCARRARALCP